MISKDAPSIIRTARSAGFRSFQSSPARISGTLGSAASWKNCGSVSNIWLVVSTPLNNISQLGWLFPIFGKIKNVPNHQPDYYRWVIFHFSPKLPGKCQKNWRGQGLILTHSLSHGAMLCWRSRVPPGFQQLLRMLPQLSPNDLIITSPGCACQW